MKVWGAGKPKPEPLGEPAQAKERREKAVRQLGCPAATAPCSSESTWPLLRF